MCVGLWRAKGEGGEKRRGGFFFVKSPAHAQNARKMIANPGPVNAQIREIW